MILSDTDIKNATYTGDLGINPWREEHVRPASYDVQLGGQMLKANPDGCAPYSIADPNPEAWTAVDLMKAPVYLMPGEFVLGSTIEWINLGPSICAQLQGKSTTGRCGIQVHATAGFVDPGFQGNLTLEISNIGNDTIILHYGEKIAQLIFHALQTRSARPYGSNQQDRYQGQFGATAPRPERRA